MKKLLFLVSIAALAGVALVTSPPPAAAVTLTPSDIDWNMVAPDVVRFHLHFHNDGPGTSDPVSGTMYSQEFGAFLPDYGVIGTFNVPPLMPESFFDVFFDVPLSSLPPSPGPAPALGSLAPQEGPCPPPFWVGNVDVTWTEPDTIIIMHKHFGTVGVCPGGTKSCVHLLTGCGNVITWAFRNVCAGWTVTLENEDHSPAPAQLPAGWTGYICVSANANVPIGSQCCFKVDLTCLGVTATIDVCAEACECPTPAIRGTWGRIKTLYR